MKRLSWLVVAGLGVALFVSSGSKAVAQAPIYVQPVPVGQPVPVVQPLPIVQPLPLVQPLPVVPVTPLVPVEVVGYPYKKAWKYATGRAPARAYYGPRRYYRAPRVVVVY